MQVQAVELHKHHWPLLWDPYIMGGHPLLGQAQPGVMFAVELAAVRGAAAAWFYSHIGHPLGTWR